MRLTTRRPDARRRALIAGGGLAATAFAAAGLLFAQDAAIQVAAQPPPPPTMALPQPSRPRAVSPQPTPPQDLRLHGLAGAGAIIAVPGGDQRLVVIGRDVAPGLRLTAVAIDHAILSSSSATYRLGFDGPAAGVAASASVGRSPPAGGAASREEILQYRLGLAPVAEGGRISRHVVRAGAVMPALDRAGLRAGDVILRVNGSALDDERREELAWVLANSGQVVFDIIRDGRPLRLTSPS
jgi:hypothetical protein